MRSPREVRVYGAGRSGSAYARRLRDTGYEVTVYERYGETVRRTDGLPDTPAIIAVLAVPRGTDVPVAMRSVDTDQVPDIVDLTTQSPGLAESNAVLWASLGGRNYHAGGSNGGERAVMAGRSCLLLGPRTDEPVWSVVRDIGQVTEFSSIAEAVTLKLCHNAHLVIVNCIAAQLAAVCGRRGIPLAALQQVIEDGPAGRRFGELTAIRHLTGGYETSYVGEYAAKDWRHFLDTLTPGEIEGLGFLAVDAVEARLARRSRGPWI